jgi:hypothetical protein
MRMQSEFGLPLEASDKALSQGAGGQLGIHLTTSLQVFVIWSKHK